MFGTWLWAFIPLLTVGIAAPAPILHAAAKLRSSALWIWTAVYGIAWVAMWAIVAATPPESDAGGGLLFALMIACTVYALILRSRVFPRQPRVNVAGYGNQWAYAAADAARKQRENARALAARDPMMARDLRIGRPDLPGQFDDGGLVDVNHAPHGILVTNLGFDTEAARRIVETRTYVGEFTSAEDLSALAGVPPARVDWMRDRMIFLRF